MKKSMLNIFLTTSIIHFHYKDLEYADKQNNDNMSWGNSH